MKIRISKRFLFPDYIYNSLEVSKLINILMKHGKKDKIRKIVYKAFEVIKFTTKKNPLFIFSLALDNIAPIVELKKNKNNKLSNTFISNSIIVELDNIKRSSLSLKWIKYFSRRRKEKTMYFRLANEILDAYGNKGDCIKKRESYHKLTESNRTYYNYK